MKTESFSSAYDFSFQALTGACALPLDSFKDKVILIVNTASKCGFTSQYTALEKLYQTYQRRGLVVIGVPSNDFAGQEPESNLVIAEFCQVNYGVTFPMTAKVTVSGKEAHPFFRWAKQELGFWAAPRWNFHKYLINRRGELVTYFYPFTAPDSRRMVTAIETCIAPSLTSNLD